MTNETRFVIERLANPAQVEEAGRLLARALAPSYAGVLTDPADRLAYCTLLYVANTRWSFDRGTVWIASRPGTPMVGVLSVIPKPEPEWSDEDETRYGYLALAEWNQRLEGPAPDEDAAHKPLDANSGPWLYVNVLGVEPSLQGNGIGTALMRHVLGIADREALPVGLITDTRRNVRFYERLGFAVLREGQEADPLILWALRRDPPSV